jgi:hypothetical protein
MITAVRKTKQRRRPSAISIERCAHKALASHCHFRGRADGFQFEHDGGVLTVRGRVPSFYLKQVLQTILKRVEGVRVVDNQVDVVSCDGLSSVRANSRNRGVPTAEVAARYLFD